MFERSEFALKIACGLVLALVVYRLGLFIVHINPLYHVTIPALPELTSTSATSGANTNANSAGPAVKAGSNMVLQPDGKATNVTSKATNLVARSSNLVQRADSGAARGTNNVPRSTNLVAQATNSAALATNALVQTTNSSGASTNRMSGPGSGQASQLARMGMPIGLGIPGMPPGGMPGMPPGGLPGTAKPGPELPLEIQSRIDRVVDSEILAPVMRPLPMALLGIAGSDVFLRAPNGQTGLIKEGEELGGIKLVRIGMNRVLVEQQGEQKELTIFAGLGGETLLSIQKNSHK
jgi:hypothetical protein